MNQTPYEPVFEPHWTDDDFEIDAAQLNALGYRNWKGEPFTTRRTRYVRLRYGLKSRFDRLRDRGFLTGEEMARQLGVCVSQVHLLGRAGVLPRQLSGNEERCLYAPLNGAVLVSGRGGRHRSTLARLRAMWSECALALLAIDLKADRDYRPIKDQASRRWHAHTERTSWCTTRRKMV